MYINLAAFFFMLYCCMGLHNRRTNKKDFNRERTSAYVLGKVISNAVVYTVSAQESDMIYICENL